MKLIINHMPLPCVDYVVHHADCADGDCAAWVVKHYYETLSWDTPHYIPCAAGKCNTLDLSGFVGKRVLFLDICPDLVTLGVLAESAAHVTIIDHHKTNWEALHNYVSPPNVTVVFQMDKGACQMAWDQGLGGDYPWFVKVIGNRDVWDFSWPMTKEYFLGMQGMGLLNSDGFQRMYVEEGLQQKVLENGLGLKAIHDRNLAMFSELAEECVYGESRVWAVNCTVKELISDLGNVLMARPFSNGSAPDFAVIWSYNLGVGNFNVSMRSTDDKRDVSAICKMYGGGGHRNAAGCKINVPLCDVFVPSYRAAKPKADADAPWKPADPELLRGAMLNNLLQYLRDDCYNFIMENGVMKLDELNGGNYIKSTFYLQHDFRKKLTKLVPAGTDGRTVYTGCVNSTLERIKSSHPPFTIGINELPDYGYEFVLLR
jgi:oligoribonuclease NrnB/cAMP/cGMP phosphodiesterase (DHH superfamily)